MAKISKVELERTKKYPTAQFIARWRQQGMLPPKSPVIRKNKFVWRAVQQSGDKESAYKVQAKVHSAGYRSLVKGPYKKGFKYIIYVGPKRKRK